MSSRTVLVPPERVARWFENFETRHGEARYVVDDGLLVGTAADGATVRGSLPFGRTFVAAPRGTLISAFGSSVHAPVRWGVLLVRKGGFAVAAGTTTRAAVSKVGQRHVQGRTKAGGQSQQRFARRRDNQARQAYAAAADHAHRVLVTEFGDVQALVSGGDRTAVEAVLADPRLAGLSDVRVEPWLAVPDPRRAVLDQAIADAHAVRITITDPTPRV